MKINKSFLNYVFWGIASLFLVVSIGVSAFGFTENKRILDNVIPMASRYGICILFAIAVLGIVFGFDKLKKNEKLKEKLFPENTSGVSITGGIEIGAMFFLTVIAIVIRVVAMVSVDGRISGDTVFFDCVANKVALGDASLSNGAHLYVSLLYFFLDFLGYKSSSAMIVSLIFNSLSLVLIFFSVRKLLGSAPAWFAFLLMAYMPGSFMGVTYVSPDNFYLFVFSLYLFATSVVLDMSKTGKIKFGSHMFLFIGLGLFGGFIAYLDIIGLVLPFVSIMAFCSYESDDLWNNKQKGWCQGIYYAIAYLVSFIFLTYQFSWLSPYDKIEGLIKYGYAFIPKGINLEAVCPHFGKTDGIGLYCVALIWIIVFVKDEFDRAMPFMAVIAISSISSLLGMDFSSHSVILSAMWCVVGGIGIYSMPKMINMGMTEEQIDERKMKKIEKENRKAYENGERSIKLAPAAKPSKRKGFKNANSAEEAPVAPVKKGYGIGKKSQSAPAPAPTPVAESVVEPVEQQPVVQAATGIGSSVMAKTSLFGDSTSTASPEEKREDRPIIGLGVNSSPIIKSETLVAPPMAISNQSPLTSGTPISADPLAVNSSIKNSLGGESSLFSGVSGDSYNTNYGPSTPTFSYDVTSSDETTKLNINQKREVTITPESTPSAAPASGIIKSDTPVIASPLTADNVTPVAPAPTMQIGVNSSYRNDDSLYNKMTESAVIKSDSPVTMIQPTTPAPDERIERPITHIGFGTAPSSNISEQPASAVVKSDTPVIGSFVSGPADTTITTPVFVPGQQPAAQTVSTPVTPVAPAPAPQPAASAPSPMIIVPIPGSENSTYNQSSQKSESDSNSSFKRPTTLIRNPLSTPKPHVPKEMDYDHNVRADQMHYDHDTFGKDFYDI